MDNPLKPLPSAVDDPRLREALREFENRIIEYLALDRRLTRIEHMLAVDESLPPGLEIIRIENPDMRGK